MKGNPVHTVIRVAAKNLIILAAFVSIIKFLIGISNIAVFWDTLILSVVFKEVKRTQGNIADSGKKLLPRLCSDETEVMIVTPAGTPRVCSTVAGRRLGACRDS